MDPKKSKCKSSAYLLLTLILAISFISCESSSPAKSSEEMIKSLAEDVLKDTPEPLIGSVGGEWAVMGIAKSGIDVPDDYFEIYYDNVRAAVKSKNGKLTKDTYTDYARVSLALLSIEKDPTDVEGYDLIEPLDDYKKVIDQGVNGSAYALIASNTAGIKLKSEEKYIDYILDSELKSGGFGLGEKKDYGITAMMVQALAPYKNRPEVDKVIDRSLQVLKTAQDSKGHFESGSETISQIILTLNALGEDPESYEGFGLNDKNLYHILAEYKVEDGLAHKIGEAKSNIATEQGLYALALSKNSETNDD